MEEEPDETLAICAAYPQKATFNYGGRDFSTKSTCYGSFMTNLVDFVFLKRRAHKLKDQNGFYKRRTSVALRNKSHQKSSRFTD